MHPHPRQNRSFAGLSGGCEALLAASYRFSFNGQERTDEIAGTGNHTTALYWEYDTRLGRRWNVDPVPQIILSDYSVLRNSPIIYKDVLGNTASTEVKKNENGTFTVTGGKADGDLNIYVVDENGKRTGEVAGQSATEYSFLNDKGKAIKGAIIDPGDESGNKFLTEDIINAKLGLLEYMMNATKGEDYDFKRDGKEPNDVDFNNPKFHYRGMPLNVKGISITSSDPNIYASARDIGNIAAGFVAGNNGLTWVGARLGFDALESYQQKQIASEGPPTKLAERMGYNYGSQLYKARANEILMRQAMDQFPRGPKF